MDERQQHYLKAMGIQAWVRRELIDEAAPAEPAPAAESILESAPVSVIQPQAVSQPQDIPQPKAAAPAPVETPVPAPAVVEPVDVSGWGWEQLAEGVKACRQCDLYKTRMNAVLGVGDRQAQWMLIGEAPGADEDRQAEPFVGRAGQLLNEMLKAVGLKREQVYIANILKCRPPNNRDPKPEEVAACGAYLQRQIELVQPKLIIALGRIAAQNLLHTEQSMAKLRGQVHTHADSATPMVVTYHPAYLLRSPAEKRKSWQDLKLALSVFDPRKPAA
jgi:uracil-DNA glycosylase family 4